MEMGPAGSPTKSCVVVDEECESRNVTEAPPRDASFCMVCELVGLTRDVGERGQPWLRRAGNGARGVQVFQVLWLWYVIPVRTTRPEEGGRGSGENQTSGGL